LAGALLGGVVFLIAFGKVVEMAIVFSASKPSRVTVLPPVSVIIPTRNERERLPTLLRCLLQQDYPELEVIVSDNHSTDETKEICRDFNVRIVDGGLPGQGRNAGAKVARGEYLLFLDADTYIPEGLVRSLMKQLQWLQADAASCRFRPINGGWGLKLIHAVSNTHFWVTTKLGFPHCIGGCLIVRRELHDAIGGFDETVTIAEDQDYVRRLAKVGRYRFFLRPIVSISARRFMAEGTFSLCMKWVLVELYRLAIGELRKNGLVKYF
jgi:glycosyltransferase involved in cell wall biosynthesis